MYKYTARNIRNRLANSSSCWFCLSIIPGQTSHMSLPIHNFIKKEATTLTAEKHENVNGQEKYLRARDNLKVLGSVRLGSAGRTGFELPDQIQILQKDRTGNGGR